MKVIYKIIKYSQRYSQEKSKQEYKDINYCRMNRIYQNYNIIIIKYNNNKCYNNIIMVINENRDR